MDMTKLMRIMLVIGNFVALILAIIILSMSIGHWHEYAGGAFSLIVAIFGFFVACMNHHIVIISYAGLVGLDILFMLANAIYLTIIKSQYSDYCFYNDGDKAPWWGCHDWRSEGYYERATGVMVCLFLAVIFRALNFASACLIARSAYDDQYGDDEGVGELRQPHDLGEKGRQF